MRYVIKCVVEPRSIDCILWWSQEEKHERKIVLLRPVAQWLIDSQKRWTLCPVVLLQFFISLFTRDHTQKELNKNVCCWLWKRDSYTADGVKWHNQMVNVIFGQRACVYNKRSVWLYEYYGFISRAFRQLFIHHFPLSFYLTCLLHFTLDNFMFSRWSSSSSSSSWWWRFWSIIAYRNWP